MIVARSPPLTVKAEAAMQDPMISVHPYVRECLLRMQYLRQLTVNELKDGFLVEHFAGAPPHGKGDAPWLRPAGHMWQLMRGQRPIAPRLLIVPRDLQSISNGCCFEVLPRMQLGKQLRDSYRALAFLERDHLVGHIQLMRWQQSLAPGLLTMPRYLHCISRLSCSST